MQLRHLGVRTEGTVTRLTLSGAALSAREAAELHWAASQIHEDRAVHVVVLDTAGDDFCPGPAPDLDAAAVDPAAAIGALRPPVVAGLRGRTASVGLEIALAADIRVAAPGSAFAMPDVAEGRLPCWGGTQRLPRAVGRPFALRMLLLGEQVDADAALARGLVHEIGDAGPVAEALTALGPLALEYAKEAVLAGSELPMREGLKLEADLGLLLHHSRDRAGGIDAFLRKSTPGFEGR